MKCIRHAKTTCKAISYLTTMTRELTEINFLNPPSSIRSFMMCCFRRCWMDMLPQELADSTHVEIERTFLLREQFHRIVAGKSSAHRGKCSGEKIEQIFITYEWHWRMRNGAKQEEIEFIFGVISRKASFYRTKTKRAYLQTCSCVDGSNLLMLLNNLNFDVMKKASRLSTSSIKMVPGREHFWA